MLKHDIRSLNLPDNRTNPFHRFSGKKAATYASRTIRATNRYFCKQTHAGRNRTLQIILPLTDLLGMNVLQLSREHCQLFR